LVSPRAALYSGVVTAGLVLLVVWIFELPLERAAVLAPVLVVVAGAAAGLLVLWTKVGWESLRGRAHPWRIVALGLAVLAVLVALSALGVKLPRE
jgi:preprotein translocase subunit Sec61beta